MNKRRFLLVAFATSTIAEPLASLAQQKEKVWRIGTVHGLSAPVAKPHEEAFLAGMRDRGYVIGRNLIFDSRFADGDPKRYPMLVDEVIALKPDVLIGANTAVSLLMKSKTERIPIVLATSGDPVGDGLVHTLARPGGNVTGVSLQLSAMGAKHIELMGDLLPRMRRVALLFDRSGQQQQNETYERLANTAAAKKGFSIQIYRIDSQEAIREAFRQMKAERPDVLVAFLSPRLNNFRREIAETAVQMRVASIAHQEGFPQDGGLMSYGPSFVEGWRRVPYFVDRILKGAKPSDLPVEQPMKFELVLNMKTAKALGIKIPPEIMVQATQVIE